MVIFHSYVSLPEGNLQKKDFTMKPLVCCGFCQATGIFLWNQRFESTVANETRRINQFMVTKSMVTNHKI